MFLHISGEQGNKNYIRQVDKLVRRVNFNAGNAEKKLDASTLGPVKDMDESI
jgi:hypothetical protein